MKQKKKKKKSLKGIFTRCSLQTDAIIHKQEWELFLSLLNKGSACETLKINM